MLPHTRRIPTPPHPRLSDGDKLNRGPSTTGSSYSSVFLSDRATEDTQETQTSAREKEERTRYSRCYVAIPVGWAREREKRERERDTARCRGREVNRKKGWCDTGGRSPGRGVGETRRRRMGKAGEMESGGEA